MVIYHAHLSLFLRVHISILCSGELGSAFERLEGTS